MCGRLLNLWCMVLVLMTLLWVAAETLSLVLMRVGVVCAVDVVDAVDIATVTVVDALCVGVHAVCLCLRCCCWRCLFWSGWF